VKRGLRDDPPGLLLPVILKSTPAIARCDLPGISTGAAEAGTDDASALNSVEASVMPLRLDKLALELVLGRLRSSSDMVDSPERHFRESESPSAQEVRDP